MTVTELLRRLNDVPLDWEVRVRAGKYGLEEQIDTVILIGGRRTGVLIQIPEDK